MDPNRDRRRQELDESIAINNGSPGGDRGNDGLLQRPLFIIVALVLSPSVGFCWRLMLVSFLSAYYYALFVERSYRPPRDCGLLSFPMAQFAFNTAVKLSILAGLTVWCLSLTPVHIFAPTATDAWTPYTIHDPLRMTETMYDAGKETTLEFVGSPLDRK